jgi:hypothetical protein
VCVEGIYLIGSDTQWGAIKARKKVCALFLLLCHSFVLKWEGMWIIHFFNPIWLAGCFRKGA